MSAIWILPVGALVFLIIGLTILFFGRRARQTAAASVNWPSAPATITSSDVEESTDSDNHTSYAPSIRYRYRVDGVEHTGKRIRAGGGFAFANRSRAEEQAARYPVGMAIRASYSPQKHDFALIEPGSTATLSVFWIVGGVFTGVGFVGLIVGIALGLRYG